MTARDVLGRLGFLDDVHVVGGYVRDWVLGNTPSDIDVACYTRPGEVMARAEQEGVPAHATGLDHGTVTLVLDGTPVEVTTFRRDVSTDGRRATVEFAHRIEDDLKRRDFTINAMALSLTQIEAYPLSLTDPFGGIQDCDDGVIRTVGRPSDRFREDLLRPVRALRFAHRFRRFTVDHDTERAMLTAAPNVYDAVSTERILQEIKKALKQSYEPSEFVRDMNRMGWLKPLIGGGVIDDAIVDRAVEHVDAFAPGDRFALVAGFILDTDRSLDQLPVSNAEKRRARKIRRAVEQADGVDVIVSRRAARWFQHDHADVIDALSDAQCVHRSLLRDTGVPVSPIITGSDLIDHGLEPGPALGTALDAAHELQINTGTTSKAALIRRAKRTYENIPTT